jgi:DNA-directed RNA polymerase specialized sigma24 family protein
MPLGSVKSTIRRALQRLREHLSASSASPNTVAP